jgi:hypothetical protein
MTSSSRTAPFAGISASAPKTISIAIGALARTPPRWPKAEHLLESKH